MSISDRSGGGDSAMSGLSFDAYTRCSDPVARSRRYGGMVASPSFSTKQSTSGNDAIVVVNSGPPATMNFPCARARATTSRAEARCTSMPVMYTWSAHSISLSCSAVTFRSTSFLFHASGIIAATVSRPSGGSPLFLLTKRRACLKLQNVTGHSGLIKSAFMAVDLRHGSDGLRGASRKLGGDEWMKSADFTPSEQVQKNCRPGWEPVSLPS